MSIITIFLIFVLLAIAAFILYKILKWSFQEKARIIWVGLLIVVAISSLTTYKLFFVQMTFVQSTTYPNLYLIKNPVEEKDSVYKAIKNRIVEKLSADFLTKLEASKKSQQNTLSFYEYYTGDWGEHGTAYFLEHIERQDGMTAELLEYYPNYLLAKFSIKTCDEESFGKLGVVAYYNKRKLIRTDTLHNSCKKQITPTK